MANGPLSTPSSSLLDDRSTALKIIEQEVGGALAEAAKKVLALGFSVDEAGELLSAMFAENDALAEVFIEARNA